jgi:hypothetical protein
MFRNPQTKTQNSQNRTISKTKKRKNCLQTKMATKKSVFQICRVLPFFCNKKRQKTRLQKNEK